MSLFSILLVMSIVAFTLEPGDDQPPVTVSPGGLDRVFSVGTSTPTFSWAGVDHAHAYELVVFSLPDDLSRIPQDAEPALEVELPGNSVSWTPSLEQALPAGNWVWFIRSQTDQPLDPARVWSEPRLFRVALTPTVQDVREALELVARWSSAEPGVLEEPEPRNHAVHSRAPALTVITKGASLATPNRVGFLSKPAAGADISFAVHAISSSTGGGSAGLAGESSALTGATAGVFGQAASAAGSAGIFDNTGGGDILRGLSSGLEKFRVDAAGVVTADGSGLTNLAPGNIATGTAAIDISGVASNISGVAAISNGGTSASDATTARSNLGAAAVNHTHVFSEVTGALPSSKLIGTYSGAMSLTNAANTFSGDGSALTGISASDPTKVAKAGDTMTGRLNLVLATTYIESLDSGKDISLTATTDDFSDIKLNAQGDVDLDADDDAFLIGGDRVELQSGTGRIELDSGDDILLLPGFGNGVGIGTTGVSFLLEVDGSAGKPGGGTWSNSSDYRLKTGVEKLIGRDALEAIGKLQGVSYEFINQQIHVAGRRVGFIAQDVEAAFPDWVEDVRPRGPDYELVQGESVKALQLPHDFFAYLVEAIKELEARNKTLRRRLEELEAENAPRSESHEAGPSVDL